MNDIQQPRRKFLRTGLIGFCTAFIAGLPKAGFSGLHYSNPGGIVVQADEGEHILTGRSKAHMNLKISRTRNGVDNISFCTEDIIPGRKLRIHKHLYNDELIFIHKGEGTFTLDEKLIEVKTGTVIFIPRGMWHGLENTGQENILMVFQYSPAGFEGYFRENGTVQGMEPKARSEAEYAATEKKYGMVYR
jgi:quercetin dioxygenase-like cupin family protein